MMQGIKHPRLKKSVVFAALLFSCSLYAAEQAKADLKKPNPHSLYLFEKDRQAAKPLQVQSEDGLLPHRIYLHYDEDLHTWVFQKAGYDKQFAYPPEYLRPGTIAPGSVIGAKLALQRFLLQPDGKWTPTLLHEQYKVWIKSSPPTLKILTYSNPAPQNSRRMPAGKRDLNPKTQIK